MLEALRHIMLRLFGVHLTPDDAVISPDQFRNPGVGSGGGPAPA